MFLIEITIQVSFTSCCTSKKRKKVVMVFFRRFFFSLAQLSYEYISLGFFAGFLFFLLACFLCFLGFCSLVVVFFFRNLGVKNKNIISFSLARFVFFWLFFFLSSILFITCKKKLWRVAKFFVVVEGFFGVVLGSNRIRNFFFGELDLIFFGHFFCLS